MSDILRFAIASCVVVAAVLAWWFPAPMLIRGELVDWGGRYEAEYAPPSGMMLGTMDLAMARLKAGTAPTPLTEFIAAKTDGYTFKATDAAWAEIFAVLDAHRVPDRPMIRFFKPTAPPFSQLDDKLRYVEWRDGRGVHYMEYQPVLAKDFTSHAIPDDLRFPLRAYWPYLVCGVLAIGYWGFMPRRRRLGIVESSRAEKGLRISVLAAIAFLGMILWPFIYQNEVSDFFGVILIGGILLLASGIAILSFIGQRSALRRIIEDHQYLAHFTYSAKEWDRYIEWRFKEESSIARFGFLVMAMISLVVSLGVVAVEQDEISLWISGGLMGFIVLIGGLGMGAQRLAYRRNRRHPGEVYVSEFCCYINGAVRSWNSLMKAELKTDPVPHMLVVYSQPSRSSTRGSATVHIPVPIGQETVGRKVVAQLMEKHHDKQLTQR